ncbi:TetR/AcrR family transcriptional regulator [Nocardia brasiliensis]|uniref:TetR family transcriptional regulator n=1 Tax=Nocardia brasiliensis (strain ATCC 700358 / HUJEG-1) TaxID=1133849 RepID=K0F2Z6_NOCB7|nr:TetR/AcrR family transcriptional regulator [Nocardia brasiliensis]AFU03809.1 TetR family transcriptional regulator [Nocardia brasiliensis ATCC 700358]OCF89468.1 TetR family transcriptional regulator [Nocardia brasiliensis]
MRRRRGKDLEEALLGAAWAELTERGYAAFTLEAVAERAGTSTPVIYRRWANKALMVEAALAHESSTRVVDVPDTGTLRGDLIALMHAANRSRVDLLVVTAVLLDGYFTERRSNPEQLRARMLADRRPAIEAIIERALDRGEIDASTLKPHLISLPLDLFRHEVLMTLKPVSGKTIEQIVDDITMPLLTQRARRTAQEA